MTPRTVAYQILNPWDFSRQEYQSGLPFPSAGDLPGPGVEPRSPALQADALPSGPPGKLCFGISCRGMGQQWTAAGAGLLSPAAWVWLGAAGLGMT